MSKLASAVYGAEAAKMGLPEIPTIFNGDMMSLMPEDPNGQISVRKPDYPGLVVIDKFAKVRDSVFPYVMLGEREPKEGYDYNVQLNNRKHATHIVGKLLVPSTVKTGTLFNIGVEAFIQEELVSGMMGSFQFRNLQAIEDSGGHTVFLVITAMLRTTVYTPEPLAGIAAVYRNTASRSGTPSPCFVTAALGPNVIKAWYQSRL